MYSIEEVNQILESGPLSEGLFRLEQFAKAHKEWEDGHAEAQAGVEGDAEADAEVHKQGNENEELAKWAFAELTGWERAGDEFPDYRRIPIQILDRLCRPVLDAKGSAVMVEMPILYGVRTLEQNLRKGMTMFHEERPRGTGMKMQAQQIGVLFQAIRHEARHRLAKGFS